MWPLLSGISLIVLGVHCLNLQIDEFYVKSFVPDEMQVASSIEHLEVLNLNLTFKVPFPGKLLIHLFVRKLSDQFGGSDTTDLVRFKNLDLCKILESLRNMTLDNVQGESLLPSTFFVSCPLVPGFYFVENATIDSKLVPVRIPDGRYMALIELIQVYEEVIKIAACRIKFAMRRPPGYKEPSEFDSSEETRSPPKPLEQDKHSTEDSTEGNQDQGLGVTQPSDEYLEENTDHPTDDHSEAPPTEPSEDSYDAPNDYY